MFIEGMVQGEIEKKVQGGFSIDVDAGSHPRSYQGWTGRVHPVAGPNWVRQVRVRLVLRVQENIAVTTLDPPQRCHWVHSLPWEIWDFHTECVGHYAPRPCCEKGRKT